MPLKILLTSAALVAIALSHFLSSRVSKPVDESVLIPNCANDLKVPVPDRVLSSLRIELISERIVESPVKVPAVGEPSALIVTFVSALIAFISAL
ncbi:hypothetical protein D3C73_1443450 [compost metagenome]